MGTKVIVIAGPTASGKTYLSLKLASIIPSEIISADSRQIYKLLNIGTAKPAAAQLQSIKHHLIDDLDPSEEYNVSRFEKESLKIIEQIMQRKNLPIVTGGSGLYIKALVDGIFDTADTDENYRRELLEIKNRHGIERLYRMLVDADPESAAGMLPQNWKRVMRALEVHKITGRGIRELQKEYKRQNGYQFVQYALNWNRKLLYDNINKRVDEMISGGLENEVRYLLSAGYDRNLNALNTVGYKEMILYINGEISLDRAAELIKRNTRRYAKRQITWFNADSRIKWITVSSREDLDKAADLIINNEGLNERKN